MYEGYLQHDAQEVLQCILGYIQEACETIRKEQELEREGEDVTEVKVENGVQLGSSSSVAESKTTTEEDGQVSGKRKSDTEVGNAKKKPKSVTSKKSDADEDAVVRNKPLTRSKRRSSSDITVDSTQDKDREDEGMKKLNMKEGGGSDGEGKSDKASKEADGKRKKKTRLSWLRPSGKQPSIFSKFRSVGKISSMIVKNQNRPEQENGLTDEQSQNEKTSEERSPQDMAEDKKAMKHQGITLLMRNGTWERYLNL